MRYGPVDELMRAVSRFAMVSVVGGLAAGCSAESSRFSENPFSNPFGSAAAAAPDVPTPNRAPAMRTASISAAPLAPVSGGIAAPGPVAAGRTGGTHWTTRGGTTITVARGDTLAAISDRYGVPPAEILSANGIGARDVVPGRQMTIPVYSAASVSPARPAPVQVAAAPAAPLPGRVVATTKIASVVPPKSAPTKVAATAAPAPTRLAVVRGRPAVADPVVTGSIDPKTRVRPGRPASTQVAVAPPVASTKVARVEPAPAPARTAKADAPVARQAQTVPTKPMPVAKAEPPAAKPAKAPAPVQTASIAPAKPVSVKAAEVPKVASAAPAKAEPIRTAREPDATGALQPAAEVAKPSGPSTEFRWPARGRVISGFGGSGSNEGINIAVPDGTPVKAAEAGTVAYAGSEVKGYGNLVLIRHDNGYVSAYAHNGDIEVKRGQRVTRGQTVAKSGQSGNVTSPQLHFELRKGSTPVDPTPLMASN